MVKKIALFLTETVRSYTMLAIRKTPEKCSYFQELRYRDNKSRKDKSGLPNGYLSVENPPGMEDVSKLGIIKNEMYPLG